MYFNKEYVFRGKHARYVTEMKETLLNRNVDILMLAPVLGLSYNRKSTVDTQSNDTTKVFADVMVDTQSRNLFNFRLCVLTSRDFTDDEKKDVCFKYYTGEDENHKELFNRAINLYNQYVLGGVEILYENMLKNNKSYNGKPEDTKFLYDMVKNIVDFVGDYKEVTDDIDHLANELMNL